MNIKVLIVASMLIAGAAQATTYYGAVPPQAATFIPGGGQWAQITSGFHHPIIHRIFWGNIVAIVPAIPGGIGLPLPQPCCYAGPPVQPTIPNHPNLPPYVAQPYSN